MIDAHPDTLALFEMHKTDGYQVPWGDSRRTSHYGVGWTPCSIHDGLYDAFPYTQYDTKFQTRQAVPTDVTIDMTVFGGGDTWDVSATICIEPTGTGKTMDVWMVQAIDHYGPANFDRNKVQEGSSGDEITLAAGECITVTNSFTLTGPSLADPDNVKFFSWAQDTEKVWGELMNWGGDSFEGYISEIYQGAKALAPFEGVFVDGFEAGDTAAWSSVIP